MPATELIVGRDTKIRAAEKLDNISLTLTPPRICVGGQMRQHQKSIEPVVQLIRITNPNHLYSSHFGSLFNHLTNRRVLSQ